MSEAIKDSDTGHWVNRSPLSIRPYLQLSRLDRPVGYWLLALPGWIGLAFATLSHGFASSDLKWAALILIGAIVMRGAACTYNDIVDQDLDAQVERTALRPLPAKTVTTRQAWMWTFIQCGGGLLVLLCLPRLAQIISLCSIPLVAAYPFMKRITWWPQLWLGLTFNWAVLVAYAAKTGTVSWPLFILYCGLIFWTVGYDTIYACQDIEDDMKIGVKSTAQLAKKNVARFVYHFYGACTTLALLALLIELQFNTNFVLVAMILVLPFGFHLRSQSLTLEKTNDNSIYLKLFKSNIKAAILLILTLLFYSLFQELGLFSHIGINDASKNFTAS